MTWDSHGPIAPPRSVDVVGDHPSGSSNVDVHGFGLDARAYLLLPAPP